jgi:hypothetical protein
MPIADLSAGPDAAPAAVSQKPTDYEGLVKWYMPGGGAGSVLPRKQAERVADKEFGALKKAQEGKENIPKVDEIAGQLFSKPPSQWTDDEWDKLEVIRLYKAAGNIFGSEMVSGTSELKEKIRNKRKKPQVETPGMPDVKANKGKTIRDTSTNKRYRSNGVSWDEVK